MFHLITHAFFKALLFLGAGSVIHGCHDLQDIRRMGGLRRMMPVTFATYAVGMMALSGVPLLFSGFWSKDEILHAAWLWSPSRLPFLLGVFGAFLTAFYMTRQMGEVFFGSHRSSGHAEATSHAPASHESHPDGVHESPPVMTVPLAVLAVFAVFLGFLGTPAWPWFEAYLQGHAPEWVPGRLSAALPMMLVSSLVVALGIFMGWMLYIRRPREASEDMDVLETKVPGAFGALRARLYADQLYGVTVVPAYRALSELMAWLDSLVIGGLVLMTGYLFKGMAVVARWIDEWIVNAGFDAGCEGMRVVGRGLSRLQGGRAQRYLVGLALGMVCLTIILVWGIQG
jgi:NADH-quinone oxidoreductase subunit L